MPGAVAVEAGSLLLLKRGGGRGLRPCAAPPLARAASSPSPAVHAPLCLPPLFIARLPRPCSVTGAFRDRPVGGGGGGAMASVPRLA